MEHVGGGERMRGGGLGGLWKEGEKKISCPGTFRVGGRKERSRNDRGGLGQGQQGGRGAGEISYKISQLLFLK